MRAFMRAVMLALGAGAMLTPMLFWLQFHAAAPVPRSYSLGSLLGILAVLLCVWLAGRHSLLGRGLGLRKLGTRQRAIGTGVVAVLALLVVVWEYSGSWRVGGLYQLLSRHGMGLMLGLLMSLPGALFLLPVFVLRHRQQPRPTGWRSKLPVDGLCILGALLALGVYALLQALMGQLSAPEYGCSDVAWNLLPAGYIAVPALLLAAWLPARTPRGGCHGPVPVSGI